MSSTLEYRPEIDGLRAIAVIAVMIFHLNPDWLVGGFLGVDVFFVISGFLLTAIISRELSSGTFSLKQFWIRRFKRLYPALFCMVTAVLIVGFFLLIRPERNTIILQSIGALLSFENILLWQTTGGYDDGPSENIALLHTWSLSLEEQFYIFLPLLLIWLKDRTLKTQRLIILLILVFSFSFCIHFTNSDRSAAFYLLPTRMWELLCGSLLALAPQKGMSRNFRHTSLCGLGVILIFTSFAVIKFDTSFPGHLPIMTCLGTMLVIQYARRGFFQRILSFQPLRYVGKISYSLYLWHWPVIVFSRYATASPAIWQILIVTILLSLLSYHYVEEKFRKRSSISAKLTLAMPAAFACCMLPIALVPSSPLIPESIQGFDDPAILNVGKKYNAIDQLRSGQAGMMIGTPQNNENNKLIVDACLIGSSHARMLAKPIANYIAASKQSAVFMTANDRGLTQDESLDKRRVNKSRINHIATLNSRLSIIAGKWSEETEHPQFAKLFKERVTLISEASEKALLVLQVPMITLPENQHGLRLHIISQIRSGNTLALKSEEKVDTANHIVMKLIKELNLTNITIIDPLPIFLPDNQHVLISEAGQFLYADYHHINNAGAQLLFDNLLSAHMPRPLITKQLPINSQTHGS